MFPILLLLLFAYELRMVPSASAIAVNKNPDEGILLEIKASLNQQHGVLAAWNTTTKFCHWPGVSCSLKHKDRVTVLNLTSQGFSGTITSSIGNLTFLRILDLSSNKLQGEIPVSVGQLPRLQHLNLSNNMLQGEITTQLKNCTSLERIELDSNFFTGEIPAWLGGLPLKVINLRKNNFTGVIPESLGNLSSLQEIYLTRNELEGTIPEGLGGLNNSLMFLDLGENHFSGSLPKTFFNISSLILFRVTKNELHGMLPSDLGVHLPNLKYLRLGMNHFTGSLPASLANATEIYSLDISFNNFTGSVPPEIGKLCPDYISFDTNQLTATSAQDWKFVTFLTNCTRLRIFDVQDNMLGAMLPSSVSNLSAQLQVLFVGYNEISGKIPFGIRNLVGLTQLELSNNRFTGVLPESIGMLNSLQALGFNGNQLTGFLPSSLGNLTQLLHLYTSHNMFEGALPTSLGRLQDLTVATFNNNKFTGLFPTVTLNISSLSFALDLSYNNFIGPLPPEVGSLTKLAYLYIAGNNLSGSIPDAISNCQSLIDLRLDTNSFNGTIPASISKMKGLIILTLDNNALSGPIPQELGLMDGLKGLYLSRNNLSGSIPETFENMTSLDKLDLSFNHLDGKVPLHGVFSNVTGFLFDGNLGLCGGIPELHLPPCLQNSVDDRKRKVAPIFKVILPIAGILFCFGLVLISISLKKKQKSQSTSLTELHLMDDKYPRVSYAELLQGTNGFDTNNLIGKGRYGSVYKCSLLLKNMMTTVAVKVFDLQQPGSSKSFISECEALTKIRHRNLISIITCCSSSDSTQNDFKALVFEFMPNGSLHRWLHLDEHRSQQWHGLTLTQRLNIAVDVADALEYLHNSCEPPIVHCDLKPSNILLDQELVGHVGDFGLAKVLPNPASEQQVDSNSTMGIRGTIGYVAPEYGGGGQVSPCGDVYSFGIVILELFTGLTPTEDMFRDGLTLRKHAENAFPGMLMNIVDPILVSDEEAHASTSQGARNAMEDINKVMLSITKLALSCSKHAPTERISMRDAAAEMRRLRDTIL
ncbi:probable LRR receptor-like serine/threonine-protein kinase At3g47570 [Miscanthus floridulus]|uniref:probable LRR receptor-like serine/threonine-protein kinase At3g47570 n=1 Tax=Miscanthus floridulus TaxID=154761 RepID=UPI00345AB5FE